MNSAAPKTYISKRMLEQYSQQRDMRKKKAGQPQQPVKTFAEDEEIKKEEEPQPVNAPASLMQMQAAASQPPAMQAMKYEAVEQMAELDRNLSCEELDSDDLGGELNLSDDDEGEQKRVIRRDFKAQKRAVKNVKANVYRQEFDTNVFEVALECLANKGSMATGDAELCEGCQAVFSKQSVLTEKDGNQIWKCEFCNKENEVMIGEEEIPQDLEVTYLLEASAQVQDAKVGGNAAQDISVVFCMDISGSMCVSQPVAGKHKIKGDNLSALAAQMQQFGDGSDQFINQTDKGMTYVSRIQCVKAAIDSQINDMANGAGQRKIGIVTFNHEVQVIGDGSKAPQTVAGDHLHQFEYLQNNGKAQAAERLTKSVIETQDILKAKLDAIEETGPTALGPGILTAVAMAAEGSPGSSVVICTDGLANIGLGAFDECYTEEDNKNATQFYERVGQIANAAGVTVSIVSIQGDECRLDSLSALAELTGGQVERVSPTSLMQDFANMLSIPVIATNVDAKVKLHMGLQFRNELPEDLSEDKSLLARRFGNTTAETVFTFEYGMKPISQLLEMEDLDMAAIQNFPFQTQIKYTALDGSKCLRVITKLMEVSGERNELNLNVRQDLLQKNCVQKGTQMARAGNIKQAQAIMKNFKRQAQKQLTPQVQQCSMMDNFNSQVGQVYGALGNAVESDDEAELDELMGVQEEEAQMMEMASAPRMMQMAEMEEQEEDVDMGGMFGGDDDDYGNEQPQYQMRSAAPQMQMQQMSMNSMAMSPPAMAMPPREMAMASAPGSRSMAMQSAPPMQMKAKAKKSKAAETTVVGVGGKKQLNDEFSAQLFKLSKQ